jgi:filamentous hemagglutinin
VKRSRKYRKVLAYAIILSMQFNSLAYAASVVTLDTANGKNPGVSQAANGVQVVDIRTPNGKGLSHNQYTNLQVDKEGLIFNNSGNISKTQLAGYINGNKYLVGNTGAKTILNEVTGSLPTSLKGYMEIAGHKADLIIANPNGIVGSNFGYINTSRAVLTTGTPIMGTEGDLSSFNVAKGSVSIEGEGLDAKSTCSMDIYARAAKINAGIWANNLNVVTGSNKIDYSTGNVQEVTSDEDKGVSLDVAALGGMYAGKITLVGTAKGLGINMEGNISSLDTDVIVNQNGDVINKGKISSAVNTVINTNDAVDNSGTISAVQDVSVTSGQTVSNTGTINAENVSVTAAGDVTNASAGNISAGNKAEVKAQGDMTNAGNVYGAASTNVTAGTDVNNTGLINGGDTTLKASGNINNTNTGRIYGDDVTLKATALNNTAGTSAPVIAARQDMTIEADTVNNKEHAILTAEQDMAITAGTVNNNSATIEAGRNMTITASAVNNTNEHFATEVQVVKEEDIAEFQGKDTTVRYKVGDYTYDPDNEYDEDATPNYDIYYSDDSDDSYGVVLPNGRFLDWYRYEYHRTIKEDVIVSTDPAKITAGSNLTLNGGTVTNDKSQIIAGGNINANVTSLNNIEGTGKQYVDDSGTTHYYHQEDSGHAWNHEMVTEHDKTAYAPPTVVTDITVAVTKYKSNTTPSGSGITARSGTYSSLFTTAPDSTAGYYVETDPAYTNKKQWLSSDYLFAQMGYDADAVAKRLGDGYYEQKLIRDQVMSLTGKRFVGSYSSDEEEYKALLDNAVDFAKNNSLTVGVALTADQLKNLTEAIVWMVEESVVLPNRQVVKALVPKVYLPETTEDNYSTLGNAVIGAENINVTAVNDILNQGTIVAGDKTNISATNINNDGGTIKGSDVILNAMNDVNNIGGAFIADTSMNVTAGHDINMTTTTSSAENANGSRTSINKVAGAYVTGENGTLSMQAGHDVNLKAADLANTGENGSTSIMAGNDLNLSTVQAGSSNDIIFNKDNYRHDKTSSDVGTSIQGSGSINLTAGNDVNATAAYVNAGKDLKVKAGNDINVNAGESNTSVVEHHKYTNSGTFSSTTTEKHSTSDEKTAVSSTFSGDTVNMEAGNDLNVTGSNVVGIGDVNLDAGKDVKH